MKNTWLAFIIISLFVFACKKTNEAEKQPTTNTAQLINPNCIKLALAQDDSLGKVRNHATDTTSLSLAIKKYVITTSGIKVQGCPENFINAMDLHRRAWLELMPVTDRYPALRGEMHELFKKIELGKDSAALKNGLKRVTDTWAEVEKTAKQ